MFFFLHRSLMLLSSLFFEGVYYFFWNKISGQESIVVKGGTSTKK